ncbi:MAG TPA: FKBP-type peptidyl-prolyl cis-trans isomerase [Acidimicrobiia bacterium]|nr:FKBP-type peptidyl-prolyl cis-trans isomerase [Acidimicrobiia bacterium]
MSSRNRERRRLNAENREAEREYRVRHARNRRWAIAIGGLVIAAAVAFFFVAKPFDDDDDSVSATDTPTTVAGSVAGKPCVAVVDPLPEGAPAVDVVVGPPPTSLVIKDLTEGTGEVVPAGASITADYIGVACTTGKIFDSSYSRGEPTPFSLDGVIKGWTDGIPGMKVGGRRLLGIPGDQAYGPAGNPQAGIAPDEPLWFVVEVKSIDAVPDSSTTTVAAAPEPTTAAP